MYGNGCIWLLALTISNKSDKMCHGNNSVLGLWYLCEVTYNINKISYNKGFAKVDSDLFCLGLVDSV